MHIHCFHVCKVWPMQHMSKLHPPIQKHWLHPSFVPIPHPHTIQSTLSATSSISHNMALCLLPLSVTSVMSSSTLIGHYGTCSLASLDLLPPNCSCLLGCSSKHVRIFPSISQLWSWLSFFESPFMFSCSSHEYDQVSTWHCGI